jgi:hypothetical protein
MTTDKELQDYATKHAWNTQMDNSKGLDSRANYAGDGMGDLVVVVGRNRDSDILSESNFQCALDMLGGESKNVKVGRFGHWACGWFELVMVNPRSKKHLKIAYDIQKSLDNYPVLDESDYNDRQSEKYSDYADSSKQKLAEALSKHFGVQHTKALEDIAYRLNMEDQYQGGEGSCINVYTCRKPDARDIDQLKGALNGIDHMYEKSKAYRQLCDAVNKYVVE